LLVGRGSTAALLGEHLAALLWGIHLVDVSTAAFLLRRSAFAQHDSVWGVVACRRQPDSFLGTISAAVRITNQMLKDPSNRTKQQWRRTMDAKWNNVVDNVAVRAIMLVVGFGAWLAISYELLSI
jgi:hypothetical protein